MDVCNTGQGTDLLHACRRSKRGAEDLCGHTTLPTLPDLRRRLLRRLRIHHEAIPTRRPRSHCQNTATNVAFLFFHRFLILAGVSDSPIVPIPIGQC